MAYKKAYCTTRKDLKELSKKQSVNERLAWIRRKASEVNGGEITASKVAKEIDVVPSVITKLESGYTKNPNLDVLQKLSNYFCVPIMAFFDGYYVNPAPFTIFGPQTTGVDVGPLFRPAYQVDISFGISSLNGECTESIQETFYLSPLEIEEFQEEVLFLINKIKKRQKKWASMLTSLENVHREE